MKESIGRAPRGIRRHYDSPETERVSLLPVGDSARELQRPELGTYMKRRRIDGTYTDTHHKDGKWKYEAQKISLATATRNGQPWQEWENVYLLTSCESEDLLAKAVHLQRTYRACESQRRDLLRKLDEELASSEAAMRSKNGVEDPYQQRKENE